MQHDADLVPELAELNLPDKSDGPGAAAFLSAGLGVLVLGLLTLLAHISSGLGTFLGKWDFGAGVGALAGKSTISVLAFLLAWAILHNMWKGKDVDIRRMFWVGLVVGGVGLLMMFPPFFELF